MWIRGRQEKYRRVIGEDHIEITGEPAILLDTVKELRKKLNTLLCRCFNSRWYSRISTRQNMLHDLFCLANAMTSHAFKLHVFLNTYFIGSFYSDNQKVGMVSTYRGSTFSAVESSITTAWYMNSFFKIVACKITCSFITN